MNIPVGYVFRPTDEELLRFLMDMTMNSSRSLPPEVQLVDLYADHSNPCSILSHHQHHSNYYYVVTKLKKMGPAQSRIRRTAGVGTWKEQHGHTVPFQYCAPSGLNMDVKGLKRNYVFHPKTGPRNAHGHWIMSEYSLLNCDDHGYVICQIHNKDCKRKFNQDLDDDRMKKTRLQDSNNDEQELQDSSQEVEVEVEAVGGVRKEAYSNDINWDELADLEGI